MKLNRIVQIVWLMVMAVCAFEAYNIFSDKDMEDKQKGWLFVGVAVLAFVRYFMLKRQQLRNQQVFIPQEEKASQE